MPKGFNSIHNPIGLVVCATHMLSQIMPLFETFGLGNGLGI